MADMDLLCDEYNSRSSAEQSAAAAAALSVIADLLQRGSISPTEAEKLIAAIPPHYYNDDALNAYRDISAVINFDGISLRTAGRPRSPKVTGRDIITDKTTGENLCAALRKYWSGRKTNNAEMGRLIAFLEVQGFIKIDKTRLAASIEYFTKAVKREAKPWNIAGILRSYNEIMGLNPREFEQKAQKMHKNYAFFAQNLALFQTRENMRK